MNSEFNSTNFDDIILNIKCETHNLIKNMVCGDEKCTEYNLFCSTCSLENIQICTQSKKHEAFLFTDFLNKYIKNEKKAFINVDKLMSLIHEVKQIKTEELTSKLIEYIKNINNLVEKKVSDLYERVFDKLEEIKKTTKTQLDSLLDDYNRSEKRLDFTNFEIPENFGINEIKEFFGKNQNNKKEMENMISLIKKYLDQEKINSSVNDLETLIYSKALGDFSANNLLDDKIKKGETLFKGIFDGLSKSLIPKKDSTLLFVSDDILFQTNPETLVLYKEITQNSYRNYTPGAIFSYTNSQGHILLAFSNTSNQIEIYDLINFAVISTLVGHASQVYGIKYFLDSKTSNDYLISTAYDRTIKVWSAKTYTCLYTAINAHTSFYLYSVIVFYDETSDSNCVISCSPNELMKVWNLSLNYIRSFGINNDYVYFTNNWNCHKTKQNYIITSGNVDFKIFEFTTGKLYKTFKGDTSTWTMSGLIHYYDDVPHLIGADGLGWLRVWNIETGVLVKSISANGSNIRGICLWNENYVCASSSDKAVKIYNLKDGVINVSLSGHKDVVSYCGKFMHPKLGEVLISGGVDAKIILWAQKEMK